MTRKLMLCAGGTSTGKTTLVNALLAEVAKTPDRVILIEDTRELQCQSPNLVALRTKDGVASLVRSSPRLRPDRNPIGEARGAEALAEARPGSGRQSSLRKGLGREPLPTLRVAKHLHERLPDTWNHVIEKDAAQNQGGGVCPHETSDISDVSLSKKSRNFFKDML